MDHPVGSMIGCENSTHFLLISLSDHPAFNLSCSLIANLVPFVCFLGTPLPHPLRTSYMEAPLLQFQGEPPSIKVTSATDAAQFLPRPLHLTLTPTGSAFLLSATLHRERPQKFCN